MIQKPFSKNPQPSKARNVANRICMPCLYTLDIYINISPRFAKHQPFAHLVAILSRVRTGTFVLSSCSWALGEVFKWLVCYNRYPKSKLTLDFASHKIQATHLLPLSCQPVKWSSIPFEPTPPPLVTTSSSLCAPLRIPNSVFSVPISVFSVPISLTIE